MFFFFFSFILCQIRSNSFDAVAKHSVSSILLYTDSDIVCRICFSRSRLFCISILTKRYCCVWSNTRLSVQKVATVIEPRHDKTNKMSVRPAKTQISLGIHPVWSESSLSTWRKLGSLATYWAHSEGSDQTGRMPRLICLRWVHSHFVGFVMPRLNLFCSLDV